MFVVKDKRVTDDLEAILISAMPTANSAQPRMKRMPLPQHLRDTIRLARKERANPLSEVMQSQTTKGSGISHLPD